MCRNITLNEQQFYAFCFIHDLLIDDMRLREMDIRFQKRLAWNIIHNIMNGYEARKEEGKYDNIPEN